MKLLTVLFALLYGILAFFIIPYIFIKLNIIYSLPIFSFLFLKVFGISLILLGAGVWLYCIGLFSLIGKGTPVPINPPKRLVISGIYRFTRNPMYLSVLSILEGYFLFFGHLLLLFYPFLIAIFFNLFILFYEEPVLKKKFGERYIKYCKETPRWI